MNKNGHKAYKYKLCDRFFLFKLSKTGFYHIGIKNQLLKITQNQVLEY